MVSPLDRQLLLGLRPEGTPTFDNFVVGANGELLERLRSLNGSELIYLWGETGSGRTHLLTAIANRIRERGDRAVDQVSAPAIDDMPVLPDDALLLVDDADQLSADGQAAMFRIFIAARERKWGLVLTGP